MSDSLSINVSANHIGLVKESSLHAELKKWYSQPGDFIELKISGYFIDIVRGDQLIEIQTQNFSAITRKISNLLKDYPVTLVYPLPVQKWIKKTSSEGSSTIRKSPKKGKLEDIFWEVVRIPDLINHPGFTFEVITVEIEETWILLQTRSTRASWRRKGWEIQDKRLLKVIGKFSFRQPADYAIFLNSLPFNEIFSSKELALNLGVKVVLAQKMIYTFKKIGLIQVAGKKGNAVLYKRTAPERRE